jgi:hypothetical protein
VISENNYPISVHRHKLEACDTFLGYFFSGDFDVLELHPYKTIPIISPVNFLKEL